MRTSEETMVAAGGDDVTAPDVRRDRRVPVLYGVLVALALAHFVQIFSPMRLDLDAVGYLSRTVSLVDGVDFGPSWHPAGYSYALAALEFVGLGNAWAFAGFNFLFFIGGVAASYLVLRRGLELGHVAALVVCGLTMLSFVYTKYLPIPLADPVYFGLSMAALALLVSAPLGRPEAWRLIAAAGLVAVAAIAVRTVGITLVAPVALGVWLQMRSAPTSPAAGGGPAPASEASRLRRPLILGLLVVAAVAIVALLALFMNHYLPQVIDAYARYGVANNLSRLVRVRLHNLGELFVNAPGSVAPRSLHVLYGPAGAIFLGLILGGIVLRRRRLGAAEAYFAAFLVVLLVYPGRQTRYWLPLVPLLLGWASIAAASIPWRRLRVGLIALYVACFALAGLAALGYSTRITFSGKDVSETFGSGGYRSVYEAGYDGRTVDEVSFESGMHRRAFLLLRRYDPRLRGFEDASRTQLPVD